MILGEWYRGVAHVTSELQQKCAFWQKLPWRLCALALPCDDDAKTRAVECMAAYDESVAIAGDGSHHRVTQRFLERGSPLRTDLEAWVANEGARREHFPNLSFEIAKLSNIPIVERCIEGLASQVKHALRHSKSSISEVSLRLHFNEIEVRSRTEPDFLAQLLPLLSAVSQPADIPRLFGFEFHPRVLALQEGPHPLAEERLDQIDQEVVSMPTWKPSSRPLRMQRRSTLHSRIKRKRSEISSANCSTPSHGHLQSLRLWSSSGPLCAISRASAPPRQSKRACTVCGVQVQCCGPYQKRFACVTTRTLVSLQGQS